LLALVLASSIAEAQPGDVLKVQEPRAMKMVMQYAAGTIWGEPHSGDMLLARWDGKAWQDTPVKRWPHPKWQARQSAPWYEWSQPDHWLIPGRDGTFLAVVVHDVYQLALAQAKDKTKLNNWMAATKAGEKLAKQHGKDHWLEGWLLRDGKWIGPLPLEKQLQQEQKTLIKSFTAYPKLHRQFNLQSDGKRLWVAYQGKVFVHEGDTVLEWKPTEPPKEYHWPPHFGMCLLPDGRMLCSYFWANEKGYHLTALRVDKGKMVAEKYPEPVWPELLYSTYHLGMYVTAEKQLWMWLDRNGISLVWEFQQNGKWIVREDLGLPLFEEADGAMWFLPGKGHENDNEDRGYRVLRGGITKTYPWPKQYPFGVLTLSRSGEVYGAAASWLFTLGPAADPLLRPLTKVQKLSKSISPGPVFRDAAGNFLFSSGEIAWSPGK
jgi:hypothetical protein